MKPESTTREVLLLTTTSFSKRQLCEKDGKEREQLPDPAEQLEAACWNGLLDDILRGTNPSPSGDNKLFLWQVEKEKSFLRLSMGDCPPVFEKRFTLDPHIFLYFREMN